MRRERKREGTNSPSRAQATRVPCIVIPQKMILRLSTQAMKRSEPYKVSTVKGIILSETLSSIMLINP
jgi:anion-transporting  ArsA/GET3 family ATPase